MSSASLSPGCGNHILFLSKTLYSHSASLLSPVHFELEGNPGMDKLSTYRSSRQSLHTSHEATAPLFCSRRGRNTPGHLVMLQKPEISTSLMGYEV